MSGIESLRVALDSLGANKLRTVLTMLGIIIGVGAVVAILAIGRSTQEAVLGELTSFTTGMVVIMPAQPEPGDTKSVPGPLTEVDLEHLRTLLPDVKAVLNEFGANAVLKYGQKTREAVVIGVQAEAIDLMPIKVAEGRWFTPEEEDRSARVTVIGSDVAKRLFGTEVIPVGHSILLGGYSFQVIGILEPDKGIFARLNAEGDQNLRVPLKWLQRVTGQYAAFSAILIVKPGADPDQVKKDALALLERNHKGAKYEGTNLAEITKNVGRVTSIITGVLSAIAGFSLVVGGVGIMNIMLVSVTERTREIGVRKAIGATYGNILSQFLIEAVILSVIGGLIGLLLAALPVWLVSRWLQIALLIDWATIAMALGFSVGVGVLFGVYPASKAARLHPIDALRYE